MADDKKISIADLSILNAVAAKLPTTEGISAERIDDGTWVLTVPSSMAKAAVAALKAVDPDEAKAVSLGNVKDVLKRAVDEAAAALRLKYLTGDAFPLLQVDFASGDEAANIPAVIEFLVKWQTALVRIETAGASAKTQIDAAKSEDQARQVVESLEWPE